MRTERAWGSRCSRRGTFDRAKFLEPQVLVLLESVFFNGGVNTRKERELVFMAGEAMCFLSGEHG